MNSTRSDSYSQSLTNFQPEHIKEFRDSAIDDGIAKLNFYSLESGDEEGANYLYEKLNIEIDLTIDHTNNGMPAGGYAQKLVNALLSGSWGFEGFKGVCAKLNLPLKLKGKEAKYLSVFGKGNQQLHIPKVTFKIGLEITTKSEVRAEYIDRFGDDFPVDRSLEDKGFWDWVLTLDKPLQFIITEGAKKACSLISAGYLAIGLNGMWGWGSNVKAVDGEKADKYGNKLDDKDKAIKLIHPDLEPFLKKNVEIVWALDRDENRANLDENKKAVDGVKQSKALFKYHCSKLVSKISDTVWEKYKGVDDLIASEGVGTFYQSFSNRSPKKVVSTATGNKSEPKTSGENTGSSTAKNSDSDPSKNLPAIEMSKNVFKDLFENVIRFDASVKQYWRYDGKGMWVTCSNEYIFHEVKKYIEGVVPKPFTPGYVRSVIEFAIGEILHEGWTEASNLLYIPFTNGVLEMGTKQLLPHAPIYGFTWQLPRTYSSIETSWEKIDRFLDELCINNKQLKDIAIAFCTAILTGRSNLQKFLYLFGSGANGKGAFMNLLSMLVGKENTHSTTMADLNENRFEAANLKNKRLVLMTDEDRRVGGLSVFKSATGQDPIRNERKGKDANNFIFKGMFVIAANSPTFVGESNFAIKRRKLDFPCLARIAENDRRDLTPEFESDLTAFTTYLLSKSDKWVTDTIRGASGVEAVKQLNWEMTIREDSIAAFYDEKLVVDSNGSVGCKKLYEEYQLYCNDSGLKSKSLNNFTPSLIELCNVVLGHSISKKRITGGNIIEGLRLKEDSDINLNSSSSEKSIYHTYPTSLALDIGSEPTSEPTSVYSGIHDANSSMNESDILEEC
jgi:putative DNA primase/helicase